MSQGTSIILNCAVVVTTQVTTSHRFHSSPVHLSFNCRGRFRPLILGYKLKKPKFRTVNTRLNITAPRCRNEGTVLRKSCYSSWGAWVGGMQHVY